MLFELLLAEKFEQDDREPFLVLPFMEGHSLAFYGFQPTFWLTTFALLTLQMLVNCIMAVFIFHFIVRPLDTNWSSVLIGYGVVVPTLLLLPIYLVEALDLRNVAMILCAGGSNVGMLLFRVLESIHATLPPYLRGASASTNDKKDSNGKMTQSSNGPSLSQFVAYYASAIHFDLDPKTGAPIPFDFSTHGKEKAIRFLSVFLQTSLCYSLLLSFDYQVFEMNRESFLGIFQWGSLLNNILMAALTSLSLESGACGLGLMTSVLTGFKTVNFSDSPLTKSSSPSDFWGKRWNNLTGPGLRRGVYQPIRKCLKWNTHIAAILTFVASGFLHEYVLFLISLRRGRPSAPMRSMEGPFVPNYGHHFFFFSWSAGVLMGERFLGPYLAPWAPNKGPFRTFLVLLTTLPVAHYFTDEYVASSFYSDISLGFPKVVLK